VTYLSLSKYLTLTSIECKRDRKAQSIKRRLSDVCAAGDNRRDDSPKSWPPVLDRESARMIEGTPRSEEDSVLNKRGLVWEESVVGS
jgi:hypothetical protein